MTHTPSASSWLDEIPARIAALDAAHLRRRRRAVEPAGDSAGGAVLRVDGREMLAFCSNDYLALAGHPDLADAARGAQMVSPYDPEVHRRLGEALLRTNHPREAIAAFDLALLTNPEDPAPIQAARARAQRALRP